MALTLTRSLLHRHPIPLSKRLLSTLSITQPPPLPSVFFSRRSLPSVFPSTPTRFTSIRCRIHRSCTPYSPNPCELNFMYYPPIERPQFTRTPSNHWLFCIRESFVKGFTEQQMIDFYIQTLAKVLGSEEEAKNSIYYVSCKWSFFGFACEIDHESIISAFYDLPCVLYVASDYDLDPKDKQYWGQLHHREFDDLFKNKYVIYARDYPILEYVDPLKRSGPSISVLNHT